MTEVPSAAAIKVSRSVMRRSSCCHQERLGFGAGFIEVRIGSKAPLLLLLPVGVYIKIKSQTLDCIESRGHWGGIAVEC